MRISPTREFLVPKPSSQVRFIDYVMYELQGHKLIVGMFEKRFIYFGVPHSLFNRMIMEEIPDNLFKEEIFNLYPFFVEREKVNYKLRKRRQRQRQLLYIPPSDSL